MTNHKSAAKKAAHDVEARLRNRANRSTLKSAIKKFLAVIAAGKKAEASDPAAHHPGPGGQGLPQGRAAQERRQPLQEPPDPQGQRPGLGLVSSPVPSRISRASAAPAAGGPAPALTTAFIDPP